MIILIFFISVATEDLKDAYGHVIRTGELCFKGNCLKRIKSHSKNYKQFKTSNSKLLGLLWCLGLVTFMIHTLVLMRICRLILTFIMLFC